MLFVDIYANEGAAGPMGEQGKLPDGCCCSTSPPRGNGLQTAEGRTTPSRRWKPEIQWHWNTHTHTWASSSVPRQTTCCQSVCTWSYVSCSSWVQNPPWPAERSAERSRTGWWRRRSPTSPAAPEQRRSATNREEEQHDFSGLHSVSTVNNLVSLCWIFSCLDPINFKPNRINCFFCFCSIIWTFYY